MVAPTRRVAVVRCAVFTVLFLALTLWNAFVFNEHGAWYNRRFSKKQRYWYNQGCNETILERNNNKNKESGSNNNTHTPPSSPYEIRRPHHRLPNWAKKFNDTTNSNGTTSVIDVPQEQELCFVHVGKTGGSSVACSLGFRVHCKSPDWTIQGSFLSQYTTHTTHNGVNDCPFDSTRYLVSVRHPMDRLVSAFFYERPTHCGDDNYHHQHQYKLYGECDFETLNDLAERGLGNVGTTRRCRKRALDFVQGKRRFGFHAYFNYRHFVEQIGLQDGNDTAPQVFVIRNEHKVQDWNRIEAMLGGSSVIETFPHINTSESDKNQTTASSEDRFLSQTARTLLCEALRDEFQAYQTFLRRALNLNVDDVQTSLEELKATCPNFE